MELSGDWLSGASTVQEILVLSALSGWPQPFPALIGTTSSITKVNRERSPVKDWVMATLLACPGAAV
ncbi:hypothetical protein SPURM210S_01575 [Streptomyces purpurascens]